MCKSIGKSNERILCKLSKSENLRLYWVVSSCHGNCENVKFYLPIKIFYQYIFHLPSFSLWAATFFLPWFGKWHNLCSQPAKTVFSHLKISCFFGSSNWTNWLLNSNGEVATLGGFCLSIPVKINLLKCGYKSENLSCLGHKRVIEISGKIDLKTTLKTPLSTDFKPFISILIKFNYDCPYTLCKQKLILSFYDPSRWKPTVNL